MTHHAFQGPVLPWHVRLDRQTAVKRIASVRGRTTANEDTDGICVRSVLREEHHGTFERVSTPTRIVVNGAGHIWQRPNRFEGDLIQQASLVVVSSQDRLARQNCNEGIQVIGISPLQPVHVERRTDLRQDLNGRDRWTIGARLATDHKD